MEIGTKKMAKTKSTFSMIKMSLLGANFINVKKKYSVDCDPNIIGRNYSMKLNMYTYSIKTRKRGPKTLNTIRSYFTYLIKFFQQNAFMPVINYFET